MTTTEEKDDGLGPAELLTEAGCALHALSGAGRGKGDREPELP